MALKTDDRENAVVSSALWAAAGDAIGWITELADEEGVRRRTGSEIVREPVRWSRRIGGRYGPTVDLPAGTYSDDTQLRLAVSRATRGNGEFDVEAFARVELPVWSSYSLGGGRGTTAAASNMTKSSVNWFSNFFGTKGQGGYFDAGGNGAAMRIQPHVWKSSPEKPERFVIDILRDAITTHGNAKGFCGAVFHGYCLDYALKHQAAPDPVEWVEFAYRLEVIPELAARDEKLGLFWLGPWEEGAGRSLSAAVSTEIEYLVSAANKVQQEISAGPSSYRKIVEMLGGFAPSTRGAGLNTALAAAALAYIGTDMSHEEAIVLGTNTIGSDTDTICSMAGAILGAARPTAANWMVQDRDYIITEARRLNQIAEGNHTASFRYPDMMSWSPPTSQSDALRVRGKDFWLAGLGKGVPQGEVWRTNDAEWQWLTLEFGQTVLAKRRASPKELTQSDLPAQDEVRAPRTDRLPLKQVRSGGAGYKSSKVDNGDHEVRRKEESFQTNAFPGSHDLNYLTDMVIDRNFNADLIGRIILDLSLEDRGIERAAVFAGIIAKAAAVRKRRR